MPEELEDDRARQGVALVFSGGIALGAYHAGAYAAMQETGDPDPDWIVGASIGATTAAIIAGNPARQRVSRLRQFWDRLAAEPMPHSTWLRQPALSTIWRRPEGWANAMQARLLGRAGLFRPRPLPGAASDTPGLYDLAPLGAWLRDMIDFDLLNSAAAPRLSVVATDIATGARVVFDTRRGSAPLGPEHLMASCALIPDFAPVEIEGRLLGDGALSANTPLDLVLDEPAEEGRLCFVLDLFARGGARPRALIDAAARAQDLIFSGHTELILEGRRREHRLRALIGRVAARLPPALRQDAEVAELLAEGRGRGTTVLRLAYRVPAGEADIQKTFDFSRSAVATRWAAGARDMQAALQMPPALLMKGETDGLVVHEVRPEPL